MGWGRRARCRRTQCSVAARMRCGSRWSAGSRSRSPGRSSAPRMARRSRKYSASTVVRSGGGSATPASPPVRWIPRATEDREPVLEVLEEPGEGVAGDLQARPYAALEGVAARHQTEPVVAGAGAGPFGDDAWPAADPPQPERQLDAVARQRPRRSTRRRGRRPRPMPVPTREGRRSTPRGDRESGSWAAGRLPPAVRRVGSRRGQK